MTIEELAALEDEWRPKRALGAMGGREPGDSEDLRVYEAWRKIFELYVIEARKGDTEALKRALFLYWYSCSEPNELSGIPNLDEGLITEMLGMVNDAAKKGELDTELRWMIPYYYFITDWYIDRLEGFHELKQASKVDAELLEELCLMSSFSARGQMGRYWKSIQDNMKTWDTP